MLKTILQDVYQEIIRSELEHFSVSNLRPAYYLNQHNAWILQTDRGFHLVNLTSVSVTSAHIQASPSFHYYLRDGLLRLSRDQTGMRTLEDLEGLKTHTVPLLGQRVSPPTSALVFYDTWVWKWRASTVKARGGLGGEFRPRRGKCSSGWSPVGRNAHLGIAAGPWPCSHTGRHRSGYECGYSPMLSEVSFLKSSPRATILLPGKEWLFYASLDP